MESFFPVTAIISLDYECFKIGIGESFFVSVSYVSFVFGFVSLETVIPRTRGQSCYSFSVCSEYPTVIVSTQAMPFDSVSSDK